MKDHDSGKEHFAEELQGVHHTCEECGFESTVLDSEWTVHAHKSSRSGHLVYEVECPDCGSAEPIDPTIDVL